MFKIPEILPSWMYRDPQTIADDLLDRTLREQRKQERDRQNKHRRIELLTRKAMQHA